VAAAARSTVGAGRCGGACRRARVRAARAWNVCEQGPRACTVLRQAENRACTTVQGARHGDLRFRAAAGHWRAAVRRCGGLRATTPSTKRVLGMTWCSPRLESAGGVAELPDHGGAEAARSELQCAAARVCGVLWWARAQEPSGNRLIRRPGHPRRAGRRGGCGDPGGPLFSRWRRGRREGRGKMGAARWGSAGQRDPRGGAMLAWAGASGRPRREEEKGKGRTRARGS
jgi:hypothetical protein